MINVLRGAAYESETSDDALRQIIALWLKTAPAWAKTQLRSKLTHEIDQAAAAIAAHIVERMRSHERGVADRGRLLNAGPDRGACS